ncbi:MAG: hypothetical protein OJF59_002487 [Cytophagales bacterium]|jgi:hypothetical protein|nr:hypothetical protein [Bacteroidota bacterium]MBS1980214.1 hypothetical protein [Bacteroidota bacterium]WHZ08733.1 MAG: hypothetical protein OJF59_002487 [Cytophagales bacterium]
MKESSPTNLEDVKKSFFHLLAVITQEEKVNGRYIRCLVKWGIQLGVDIDDLKNLEKVASDIPSQKSSRLAALYHLVYMIYLDRVVEDIELEVASWYAEKLGFDQGLVGDLFKSIATERYDENSIQDVKKEVDDFLKLHNL